MKKVLIAFIAAVCFSSCKKHDNGSTSSTEDIVYIQTNDFNSNQNAVIAYRHTGNGMLTQISGSPFMTGGTGVGNPMQVLGPSDSDQEIWMTSDKKFLLVV